MERKLRVSSPAFQDNGVVPSKYTCDGQNVSPPLHIENIPPEAHSLALTVEDPDAPGGTFTHWTSWNIPLKGDIPENSNPGISGENDMGEVGYGGPCPPSGSHHYHFKVYALDSRLDLPEGAPKKDLLRAIEGHVVGVGELMGRYNRGG